MAGLYDVINEILIAEGLFQILIDAVAVGAQDLCDVIQLTADAAG